MKFSNASNICRLKIVWLELILVMNMALLTGMPCATSAQPALNREYQVKAAFLYNFAHFVEWPAAAFPEPQSPMVIGILGDDPFGTTLDELIRNETVNGHPLIIQRYSKLEEIKSCHILYISQLQSEQFDAVLEAAKGRSLLTVGDSKDFATRGGTVQFITEKNKVRFRINLTAAKAASLRISSKLLKAAEIITPK